MKCVCIVFVMCVLEPHLVGSTSMSYTQAKIAQGTCTAILPYFQPDTVYAVRRICTKNSIESCDIVCSKLGKVCYNAVHVYRSGILKKDIETGAEGLKTHKYDTCSKEACGPNFCCCADKEHFFPSTNDEIAQASCTAMLPGSADDVYAVRRDCFRDSKINCEKVCEKLSMICFNSIHVYKGKSLDRKETGQEGLHTYRYNTCKRASCGPNFCCCS